MHILWNYKLELFDRTVFMLCYKALGKKIVFTAHNVNQARRDSKDSWLNRTTLEIQYRLKAPMPVKVAGGVLPMTMLVNGAAVGEIDSRRQRLVDSPGPGFARLTVIDATGAADTVVVRIQ